MVKVNYADHTWKELVESLLVDPEYRVAPREQKSSDRLSRPARLPPSLRYSLPPRIIASMVLIQASSSVRTLAWYVYRLIVASSPLKL